MKLQAKLLDQDSAHHQVELFDMVRTRGRFRHSRVDVNKLRVQPIGSLNFMSLNVVCVRNKVPQAPIPHQEVSARLNEQRSTIRFCNTERYGHGFVTRTVRFDLRKTLFAHLLLLQLTVELTRQRESKRPPRSQASRERRSRRTKGRAIDSLSLRK